MIESSELKKQIVAIAQLFPVEGMSIRQFELCVSKEQRTLAEEMVGTELATTNGKLRIVQSSLNQLDRPTWEMTKSFVARVFIELTEKTEEWTSHEHRDAKDDMLGTDSFSLEALNEAIIDAEASSRINFDEALIQMAKDFRDGNKSHGAELTETLQLQGIALQILLRSISENNKRGILQSNKHLYHENTGFQICAVLEKAALLPDIPTLYRYCLYEALTEYYLRVDLGIQALRNAILQMGDVDSSEIPYWRKVYANKLLLAAYKSVRMGNDDITAQEYSGVYSIACSAKAILADNPSGDEQ